MNTLNRCHNIKSNCSIPIFDVLTCSQSRSKNDNPEHLRLKERAKEMQQQELEKMQIRNADETARNAIGPRRKKARIDSPLAAAGYEVVV